MLGYGVKETTATTGTGTLTLSAVSGFPRFANAFGVGDLVDYSLLNSSGQPIECGIGTVGASNTLARTYPLVTWDGTTYTNTSPTAISLTGTTTVICTGTPGSENPFIQSFYSGAANQAVNSAHMTAESGAVTTAANKLWVIPFQLEVNRPMAGILARVTTAAGTSGTLGWYRCGSAGLPTDLLQSGTISTATTGLKSIAFSAYYPPGWYYAAIVCDGAAGLGASNSIPASSPLGSDGSNLSINALTVANGSITLPNPFTGTVTQVTNSIAFPVIAAFFA